MKITDVQAIHLRLPDLDAGRTDSSQDCLLIRIDTDAGLTGWGEVDSLPELVKAAILSRPSHTQAQGLRDLLIGQDPMETQHLWRRMHAGTSYVGRHGAVIHAMAGIDLALWDIKGKALGQPVWRLLGGHRRPLRAYSSNMFQFSLEATQDRARAALDAGFTAMKFGWEPFGRGSLDQDLRLLDALRAVIPMDKDLMLDVGHVWDARTTIQRARRFEPYNLFWIEEPVAPADYRGYRRISDAIHQPLAGGENESTIEGFRRLIEEGAVDVAQIDLARVGFTQGMIIASLAHQAGIRVANHCFTTDLNAAAALHFLTAIDAPLVVEYGVEPGEIARHLSATPLPLIDGHMLAPEEPGLGITPDLDRLEHLVVR